MKDVYDAVVIGSGATGGVAAKMLSEAGMTVLVLEAGRQSAAAIMQQPGGLAGRVTKAAHVLVTRRYHVQSRHPAFWTNNSELFVNDAEHPVTQPAGGDFVWIRHRGAGGRSLTWFGVALRLSD